jgi:hypothetical protein
MRPDTITGDIEKYIELLSKGSEKSQSKNSFKDTASDDDDDEDEDEEDGDFSMNKADKWFSHPLFQESLVTKSLGSSATSNADDEDVTQAAKDMIDSMPKTDKEKRKEKRKKMLERQNKRNSRKLTLEESKGLSEFEVIPTRDGDRDTNNDDDDDDEEELTFEDIEKRHLLKLGMGKTLCENEGLNDDFDVVPKAVAKKQKRSYEGTISLN